MEKEKESSANTQAENPSHRKSVKRHSTANPTLSLQFPNQRQRKYVSEILLYIHKTVVVIHLGASGAVVATFP